VPAVVGSWPAPFAAGYEGRRHPVALECEGGGGACGTVRRALAGAGAEFGAGAAAIRRYESPPVWLVTGATPAAVAAAAGALDPADLHDRYAVAVEGVTAVPLPQVPPGAGAPG
jgi:hypothetical protein